MVFQEISQKGRPGRREPPPSTSFDEGSRIETRFEVGDGFLFFGVCFLFLGVFCRALLFFSLPKRVSSLRSVFS